MAPKDSPLELSPDRVRELASELGIVLDQEQSAALTAYARLLQRWNRVHNLTARDSTEDLLSHHLLDSLAVAPWITEARVGGAAAGLRVLDAGAGAGLPGIPLAIACPALRMTLLDSVEKKCAFMEQAKLELKLTHVEVVHARLERYRAAAFDVIVARAFATLERFAALTRHLLKPDGRWIAMKGRHPTDELAALPKDVHVIDTVKLRVPHLAAARHLVLMRPA
jgi:16S rRNA (guanine527-N7)-methyltransferase